LSVNDEITEAAWIKIAEGVAASKSLQKLEYGARSYVLLPYFSAPPRCRTKLIKLAYFLHFLPPFFSAACGTANCLVLLEGPSERHC
jgi:hypothetical protein